MCTCGCVCAYIYVCACVCVCTCSCPQSCDFPAEDEDWIVVSREDDTNPFDASDIRLLETVWVLLILDIVGCASRGCTLCLIGHHTLHLLGGKSLHAMGAFRNVVALCVHISLEGCICVLVSYVRILAGVSRL